MLIGVLILVALIVAWRAAVFAGLSEHFGSAEDGKRFDQLESSFERDRAGFLAVDRRMRELAATHPEAVRISWTGTQLCVRAAGQGPVDEPCEEPSQADQDLFEALPDADVVVYQAKDPGRVFFSFFGNDPPMITLMSAPEDGDPGSYADERGFRSHRSLDDGWTLLGHIPDAGDADRQWP